MDKLRQDYQDGINTLKMFMDATNEKMTAPVQVSFLNVRAFVQDVEVNIEDKADTLLCMMQPSLQDTLFAYPNFL